MARPTANITLVFTLILAAASVTATQETPRPGDKEQGEEQLILKRQQHFAASHGLNRVEQPHLLRRSAVRSLQKELSAGRDAASALSWTGVGPESMTMLDWVMGRVAGRVSAIAVHPANEDIIYLGTASGGLWKTINGGASWISLFDTVGTQTIGTVTIDPSDSDTIWVGTGEQGQSCTSYFGMGLFRSTDGGASFIAMNGSGNDTLDLSFITAVVVNSTNPQIIVVGGETWCDNGSWVYGGLYRSTDGGGTWTSVITGFSAAITDLVADSGDPNTLYCAVGRWSVDGNGIYRSTDAGATWNRLETGIPSGTSVGRTRLAVAPGQTGVIYALMNISSGSSLFKTIDGGDNWTTQNSNACDGQCWYNLCLDVDPADAAHLLVGAIRFYESTNNGQALNVMTDGWGDSQTVHQDTHVVRFSRTDSQKFWVGSDGGIWRTDDGGASFTNLNNNLNITQFYDIAVHPGDPEIVFGGAQDNSSSRRTVNNLWDTTVITGDGFINIIDPSDPGFVIQTSYPWNGYPSLFLSTAGGTSYTFSWLALSGVTQNEPWPWVTPLAVHESVDGGVTPSRLFMGSDHVYRATVENPSSWTKISGDLSDSSISVITPVWRDSTIGLYVGTSDGRIHRTNDALAASVVWTEVGGSLPGDQITDIITDPTNANRVYATRGAFGASRLYRSTVGGTLWAEVGDGLPNVPANSVAVDPLDPQQVFVATDVGVFASSDGGNTFTVAMNGFPLGSVVTDLEIDDDPHILTAGTYGRGAWQTLLGNTPLFTDGFESGDTTAWSFATP